VSDKPEVSQVATAKASYPQPETRVRDMSVQRRDALRAESYQRYLRTIDLLNRMGDKEVDRAIAWSNINLKNLIRSRN
jgi:hypothetical protein